MRLFKPLYHFLFSGLLLAAAVNAVLWLEHPSNDAEIARDVSAKLQKELEVLHQEAEFFKNPEKVPSDPFMYGHFLFRDGQVTRWSTNSFLPEPFWIGVEEQAHFVRSNKGDFITVNSRQGDSEILLSVIPLVEKFRITNRYLNTNWNDHIFSGRNDQISEVTSQQGKSVLINGKELFKVGSTGTNEKHTWGSLLLLLGGLIFFLSGIYHWIKAKIHNGEYGSSFLTLVASLGALRVFMVSFNFPGSWVSSPLFDPAAFASSSFNPSIGDLLFNALAVLIICCFLFFFFNHFPIAKSLIRLRGAGRLAAASVSLLLAFFGFLFPFLFFESIFNNSSVTLDWTSSLAIEGVRGVAFLSVIIGSLSSFLFCHILIKTGLWLTDRKPSWFIISLVTAVTFFFGYSILLERDYRITTGVGILLIALLFSTRLEKSLGRVSYRAFLYFVFVILCYALQGALATRWLTGKRNMETLSRFGSSYLIDRDVLGEFLLKDAAARIADDPYIQTRLGSPLLSKGSVRQKVRLIHLNFYFDKYEVQIHLYGPSGEPLDEQSSPDFASFIANYQLDTYRTDYKGIYFVDRVDEESAQRYVVVAPVVRLGRSVGFITIVLAHKKIVPRSVYPELLVDNRFAQDFRPGEYSYAILKNDSLLTSYGEFDYEREFDFHEPDKVIQMSGFTHVAMRGEGGRVAIVSMPGYSWLNFFSNFAFWTLIGIVIVAIWLILGSLNYLRKSLRLNYAARIQLYIYFAFLIPLIAVSVTTLNWTSNSAEERLEQEYRNKASVLAEKISTELVRFTDDSTDVSQFESFLTEAAKLTGADASVYLRDGKLLATNQPLIFDNQILSGLINPAALKEITQSGKVLIASEQVGKLDYNNAYCPLRSPQSGELLGILSIPFFESAYTLERNRATILSNILIIFVLIFILFTLLSFFVIQWLTFPLRMITRSLSKTTLKGENKPLDWQSNDEIGLMVQEYNRMVRNIERSKVELARSQKEKAWREMAQQVAHEIKNPLTPMKLTLQQMELSLAKDELTTEKAEKSVDTLLEQLEILNDIATSFSAFAKMPAPELHRLEVTSLLKKSVALYQDHPLGKVVFDNSAGQVHIRGDEQLLGRIFSNLILNGLQSGKDGQAVTIRIWLQSGPDCSIYFRDNGTGIDESLKDKVFAPHFTTKKSGSGLGLAIVKQGVEQCGGSISFESHPDSGTTFFITFPLSA